MGHHSLREDKTCLNCHHVVEKRFCPNCGQENKETKESFHYLFTHTVEDIVHYDSGFWKTIKYLLFFPGKLTLTYLSGKRQSFVAPVKLYIFISFITFFIISLLPSTNQYKKTDFVKFSKTGNGNKEQIKTPEDLKVINDYKSLKEYDSIQNALPENKRDHSIDRWIERKMIKISTENSTNEIFKKAIDNILKNIPKALFSILPLFALTLWFFHNKKKWYYFDHGIFTIHYFSMLLFSFTIYSVISWLLDYTFLSFLNDYILITLFLWWGFYLYRSHSKIYKEKKSISRFKVTIIILINSILISLISLILILYSALNVN